MKPQLLKLFVVALVISFTSCKKEKTTLSEYIYTDKGVVLTCDSLDSKLYNEALFAFENDMINFYSKGKPNISRAYSQFVRQAVSGQVKYQDMITPHTIEVFNVLKKENDLWDANNSNSHLNYNSKLFNCIATNIQNKDLNTTLNALISTNSMSPKLFGTPLISNYSQAIRDKYLSAYMAFDLFYAKLFDVDLSQVNMNESEEKVDFNNTQQETTPDPHAGHNH
ncbi:hypothetical protein [uncultured Algibacter sp.]|uniref:hypothetical protein n=1 Tax=uncultured Algibacter sp. TaxID=298659 RepID=UPI002629C616|nr:hypothetical protein [uncultured Algibacter sp.]